MSASRDPGALSGQGSTIRPRRRGCPGTPHRQGLRQQFGPRRRQAGEQLVLFERYFYRTCVIKITL